jgi:hypothetical protein
MNPEGLLPFSNGPFTGPYAEADESGSRKYSVALVRERAIQTERQPLVGDASANFSGLECVTWSARRILTAVISVF